MDIRNIYLFIFDGLADWEAAYATAGINDPQCQRQAGSLRLRTVAIGSELVTTAGGMRIQPDLTLADISPADTAMLILPGGKAWDEGANMEAVQFAQSVLAGGGAVAAICGATAGLARGGMLDHCKHTSNASEYLAPTGYAGAALYQDAPAVRDGAVITASGTAPVDFAYHIFDYLEMYSPQALQAWHGLFKTGKPEFFSALMRACS